MCTEPARKRLFIIIIIIILIIIPAGPQTVSPLARPVCVTTHRVV